VIWEPFVLALVLGLVVSAGLYFAYMWPSVEPLDLDDTAPPPADIPVEESVTPAAAAPAEPVASEASP
jgi:hypothetical protein